MTPQRSCAFPFGVLAATLTAAPALAEPGVQSESAGGSIQPMSVRLDERPARFLVENPDAASSPATRLPGVVAPEQGGVGPIDGYVLTSQVILRTDQAERLAALIPALELKAFRPAPGWFTIDADSVRGAAALVELLHASGLCQHVYVNTRRPVGTYDGLPNDPYLFGGVSECGGGTCATPQWHLINTDPGHEMSDVNIEPVWCPAAPEDPVFTGAGVVVGIVEGPWQHAHPDLADNYVTEATMHDPPEGADTSHATAVAGVIGAVWNNDCMGTGVAPNAGLAGQHWGNVTDAAIAMALGYCNGLNNPEIQDPWDECVAFSHIKSNSWGPTPSRIAYSLDALNESILEYAVHNGRGGLGTVFLWAAGNDGNGDRSDYDPWCSSRYSIGVAAIGYQDRRAWYNERSSSALICAQSNGNQNDEGAWINITTTNLGGGASCNSFGGTSSACPLAAGVCALILEANPLLTWRDVQHILVNTARKPRVGADGIPATEDDPMPDGTNGGFSDDLPWEINRAGHAYSENFAFGAVDAFAAVQEALRWETVGAEIPLESEIAQFGEGTEGLLIPDFVTGEPLDPIEIPLTINGIVETTPVRCEHVEVVINMTSEFRGNIQIELVSPPDEEGGTQTVSLLADRRPDDFQDGYFDYSFFSVKHWDEFADGTWTVRFTDMQAGRVSYLNSVQVIVHGRLGCNAGVADINTDGAVNGVDVGFFLNAFRTMNDAADLNMDGAWNGLDIGLFIESYFGCVYAPS